MIFIATLYITNIQKKTTQSNTKQVRTDDRDEIHIISKLEGEMFLQMAE